MIYTPNPDRYEVTEPWFRPLGRTGLKTSAMALGTWYNFGRAGSDSQRLGEHELHENCRFDRLNVYEPPVGASGPDQVRENVRAFGSASFTPDELDLIDSILGEEHR